MRRIFSKYTFIFFLIVILLAFATLPFLIAAAE